MSSTVLGAPAPDHLEGVQIVYSVDSATGISDSEVSFSKLLNSERQGPN
jgi:hypothetical protein